eukprot:scaffold173537_cov39-Prasinocladus_malaysianus.AAC.3
MGSSSTILARIVGCLTELGYAGLTQLQFAVQSDYDNYVLSLYWAITTISTVGYGDLVAQNTTERLYHLTLMYVISEVYFQPHGPVHSRQHHPAHHKDRRPAAVLSRKGVRCRRLSGPKGKSVAACHTILSCKKRSMQLQATRFIDGITGKLRDAALKDLSMSREMGQEKDRALQHVSPYIRNTILRTLYYNELSQTSIFQAC